MFYFGNRRTEGATIPCVVNSCEVYLLFLL
jgi:hypothetical protein